MCEKIFLDFTRRAIIYLEYKNIYFFLKSKLTAMDSANLSILEDCKFKKSHPATVKKDKPSIN